MDYDLPLDLEQLNSPPYNNYNESNAADKLITEIQTSVALRRLHQQSGDEKYILTRITNVITNGRSILNTHPRAFRTQLVFFAVLDYVLEPRTTRWQRAEARGLLDTEYGCRIFRNDLEELRLILARVVALLNVIRLNKPVEPDDLFMAIPISQAGYPKIRSRQALRSIQLSALSDELNTVVESEVSEIVGNDGDDRLDGAGLAISGGGIRSATFSLGVIGELARRGLFHQFDYISTVSGGGYAGSFLTSYLQEFKSSIEQIFTRHDQRDTDPIRHLRNNSKYLLQELNLRKFKGFDNHYVKSLSSCYLVTSANGKLKPRKDLLLSELRTEKNITRKQVGYIPYHLINTTVNLPKSTNKELRWRQSDFFLLSKKWCGSRATGYAETKRFEEVDPSLNLARAMAISGAALSPNMGTKNNLLSRLGIIALTLRLDYSIPNVFLNKNKSETFITKTNHNSLIDKVSYRLLRFGRNVKNRAKLVTGRFNEKSDLLNLSDGGHIENLAVYELLRRKCKFIVAIDGECDPNLNFNGLVKLIRYARIDLGIEIITDLGELSSNSEGYSYTHYTLAKIIYPEGEVGWMLYLKLSLTGDEPADIVDYKRINPGFPHQSTLDQIYDESQFESYRKLGEHIAEGLFSKNILSSIDERFLAMSNAGSTDISTWFKALMKTQLPDNDEVFRKDPTNLNGLKVGLSMSNSNTFTIEQINQFSIETCKALIAHGATVVLGQDWRPTGIMKSVAQIALDDYLLNNRAKCLKPIINVCRASNGMPKEELPEEVSQLIDFTPSDNYREIVVKESEYRICLGGQFGSEEEMPGVLQEAWMSASAGKIVLVSGCLGGISKWLADSLLGTDATLPHYPNPGEHNMPSNFKDILEKINELSKYHRELHERLWRTTQFESALAIMLEIIDESQSINS